MSMSRKQFSNPSEGRIVLSARERILTIRLLEKSARQPLYAKALGIEGAYRWDGRREPQFVNRLK